MAQKAGSVDFSKLSFSTPRTLDNGGKMLYLNYNSGKFYIQTPELELPFDPSYFAENDTSGKFSVKVSLKNVDSDPKMKDLHTFLSNLDDLLITKAQENSQAWFKKPKLSTDTIKELYTPMVKVHLDPDSGEPSGKYPDQFGFKVVKKNNVFEEFSIYNEKKVKFDVDGKTDTPTDITTVLMKGTQVKAVLKCNGVWIANGKFGCTWRAEQIRVKVPEGGLREFAIMSDSEDEDEVSEEEQVKEEVKETPMIGDSSDEEEDEPEPEPEPPKKKAVKRKVKVSKPSA